MASLVGSIAGVAELVKSAQAEPSSPPPPRRPRGGPAVPATGA
jgi:hypothetical protein